LTSIFPLAILANLMKKTVGEIAKIVGGRVIGDEKSVISGITNIEDPLAGHLTFAQDPKSLARLEKSPIACILVSSKIEKSVKLLIQVEHPKLAWAKLLHEFHPKSTHDGGISEKASIPQSAKIGINVTIEPFVKIGERAEIGDDTVLRSFVYVGEDVSIGAECHVHPNVTLYERTQIGKNVIIHAGTTLGADGFGYVATPQGQIKIPQVGWVVIEDDVEIGACVTIDRATIGTTTLGRGCKIDNLVQIAHNVTIGPHTVISAQTGISGSSKIGAYVTMGGKVGVGDHVEIGDQTMVGAGSGLPSGKKVPPRQVIFGEPARPYAVARKQIAAQLRSAEMYTAIKQLRKEVKKLQEEIAGLQAEKKV